MIKLSSKGLLPDEFHDPVDAQINQISEGKNGFNDVYSNGAHTVSDGARFGWAIEKIGDIVHTVGNCVQKLTLREPKDSAVTPLVDELLGNTVLFLLFGYIF